MHRRPASTHAHPQQSHARTAATTQRQQPPGAAPVALQGRQESVVRRPSSPCPPCVVTRYAPALPHTAPRRCPTLRSLRSPALLPGFLPRCAPCAAARCALAQPHTAPLCTASSYAPAQPHAVPLRGITQRPLRSPALCPCAAPHCPPTQPRAEPRAFPRCAPAQPHAAP